MEGMRNTVFDDFIESLDTNPYVYESYRKLSDIYGYDTTITMLTFEYQKN